MGSNALMNEMKASGTSAWRVMGAVALLALASSMAMGQAESPAAGEAEASGDRAAYAVTAVKLQFTDRAAPLAEVAERVRGEARVELVPTASGYAAAATVAEGEATGEAVTIGLAGLGGLDRPTMQPSAIRAMARAIVAGYNEAGFGGVRVDLAADQIGPEGRDLRYEGESALVFRVDALPVTGIGTESAGERFSDDRADDRPEHQRIRDRSPVAPPSAGGRGVLRPDLIEDYVAFLNRHPGRRVDAAIAAGDEPDTLALRYLVAEAKPWLVYAQASNTGTDQTADWREQFGFVHRQLTGNDDILSIVYSTAGFEAVHAISGSYEAPLPDAPRWRYRLNAAYSEFVASDIGFTDDDFTGETTSIGGELSWNFFQRGPWFIDAFAGVRWEHIEVDNEVIDLEGIEQFLRPRVGLRTDRMTETDRWSGSMSLEWNADDLASTEDAEASELGRTDVDAEWAILHFSASGAFFLEPLIDPAGFADLSTPGSSTLAHEIALSIRGQHVLGERRAIPQAQMTAGGLYTVRGYDESTAVGDNAVVVSAEYRFHLPRVLAPQPEPGSLLGGDFRWRPPSPRGRPDWDLILKAFVDYGHTSNNGEVIGETNQDLLGAGAGAELQLKQNLTLRVEWAAALKDAEEQDAGESRVHIAATLMY